MKLCVISHAYLEAGYLPILSGMAALPGVELAWISPDRYKFGLRTVSADSLVPNPAYRFYPLPTRFDGKQGAFLYHFEALGRALDDFKPDIILHEQEVFALGASEVAYFAAKRSIPVVIFVYENIYRNLALPRQWLRRYVFQRSTAIITASSQSAKVHRDWGYKGCIEVIPQMGAALNSNPVFGRRNETTLNVCFAGRLVEDKGVECLLRAVASLTASGVPVTCTIAGQGPELDRIKALAVELGIHDQVRFSGVLSITQVAGLLRTSDVLALPSRRTAVWEEQFGRILVEAMAQGTIAVGSRTGAIPEVIGNNDLLFDQDNFAELATVLGRLAADSAFFDREQRRAWERVRDHYDNDLLNVKRVEFLRNILDQSRTASPAATL